MGSKSDGFIDMQREPGSGTGTNWITGKPERILVHRWRASEQAILVGAGTVRADNPKLNVREWTGNNPVRVILSGSGILPSELEMNKSKDQHCFHILSRESQYAGHYSGEAKQL